MHIQERTLLLQAYELEIKAAYEDRLQRFIFNRDGGSEVLRSIAGQCGARVTAAHKRCKRGLVFAALATARDGGLDITPTVAEHVCARLIGRGIDLRAALVAFGTPGRTAAMKSSVARADLIEFEAELVPQVNSLMDEMSAIRAGYRDEYDERVKEVLRNA